MGYPSDWGKIEKGQKRQTVLNIIGKPEIDWWEIKADIYFKLKYKSWYRLDVIYNTDTVVTGYMINYYFGTKTNYTHIPIKLCITKE